MVGRPLQRVYQPLQTMATESTATTRTTKARARGSDRKGRREVQVCWPEEEGESATSGDRVDSPERCPEKYGRPGLPSEEVVDGHEKGKRMVNLKPGDKLRLNVRACIDTGVPCGKRLSVDVPLDIKNVGIMHHQVQICPSPRRRWGHAGQRESTGTKKSG